MKNINKSFELSFLLGFRIWVFLKFWLTRAVVAVRTVALATTSFPSPVTVTVLFCTVGLSAITKIILKIYVWSIWFLRESKRIFLNYLVDSLGPIHVIMVIFATIAQASLNTSKLYLIAHFTYCKTGAIHFQAHAFSAIATSILDFLFNIRGKKAVFERKVVGKSKIQGGSLLVIVSFWQSNVENLFAQCFVLTLRGQIGIFAFFVLCLLKRIF